MNIRRLHVTLSATALVSMPLGAVVNAAPALAASSRKVFGPSVNMRWGPVRVAITVRGRRIVAVQAAYPTERPRSARINGNAIPLLRVEVLHAQSANVHAISGATNTSDAYKRSLAAALRAAHV